MMPLAVRQHRTKRHIRYAEWNTGCSDVHDVHYPLWKLITPISSFSAFTLFCVEVKKKWQQQRGFTCTMFHPQIVHLSEEINFRFKHTEVKLSVGRTQSGGIIYLCWTQLWLEHHKTPKMMFAIYYRYTTIEKRFLLRLDCVHTSEISGSCVICEHNKSPLFSPFVNFH